MCFPERRTLYKIYSRVPGLRVACEHDNICLVQQVIDITSEIGMRCASIYGAASRHKHTFAVRARNNGLPWWESRGKFTNYDSRLPNL
jgi:hypothetical protein